MPPSSSSCVLRITRSQTAKSLVEKNKQVISLAPRKRNSKSQDNEQEQEEEEEEEEEATHATPITPSLKTTTKTSIITTTVVTPSPKKPKRATLSPKQTKVKQILPPSPTSETEKTPSPAPPKDFAAVYSLVTELRKDRTAPCDSMGAEALALAYNNTQFSSSKAEQDQLYRLIVLISLMLSSQTKDAVVASAVQQLHQSNLLSWSKLADAQYTDQIHHCIRSVGFHNNKIKYIQQSAQILQTQFGNDIPGTAAEMMEHLPGVGPKMAYLCEALAWPEKEPSGIGVDTHMHRLFQQINWMRTKTPEHTRLELQSWLPREYWRDINLLWVGFGQEVQQQAPKVLYKAVYQCSRPKKALQLLQRCGMNVKQVAKQQMQKEDYDGNRDLLERVEQLLSRNG
ncbi:endonuclease III [Fistulifera solaris]|uniref:Endonuclease III n=1 Tax=Fistulifera solaris TaxID=1519565 RepID=A0A1Z5KAP0_FISSO|nr:endonuclease III [Fistulifera solaris]|eukprot:GAX23330.1 endonuclease III [Fistulifera solaris]